MTQTPDEIAAIIAKLTSTQREEMLKPEWICPGGMNPICLVKFTSAWPEGVAQFFTMRADRLTPLGLAVRTALQKEPQP